MAFFCIIAQEICICISRFGKAHNLEIICGLKITMLMIMITMIMIWYYNNGINKERNLSKSQHLPFPEDSHLIIALCWKMPSEMGLAARSVVDQDQGWLRSKLEIKGNFRKMHPLKIVDQTELKVLSIPDCLWFQKFIGNLSTFWCHLDDTLDTLMSKRLLLSVRYTGETRPAGIL